MKELMYLYMYIDQFCKTTPDKTVDSARIYKNITLKHKKQQFHLSDIQN